MLNGLSVPGGQPVAWHNGGFPPYQAHLSLRREQKLGVIILTNSDEASQFITQLGTRVLELAYETKVGVPPPHDSPKSATHTVQVPRDKLARYAGHYAMFDGQLGSITVDGDQLKTSLFDRSFTLHPISIDTFVPKANVAFGLISIPIDSLSIRFQTVQGRDVAVLSGLPAPFAFARVPHAEIPDVWRNRMGKYQTDTADEQFDFKLAELSTESGILVFKALLASKSDVEPETKVTIALQVVSDHEAVVAGIGNGEGGVIRALDSDNGTELVYSGFRFTRTGKR